LFTWKEFSGIHLLMNELIAGSPEQPTPASSLFNRLANIFAAPGEVYDEVKISPPATANWLAPALILVAISWIAAWLIFSQDSIKRQMSDLQAQAIQKQVEKGKLTKAQADQASATIERFGSMGMKIGAMAGPAVGAFVAPFWWGLLLWVTGNKALKGGFLFMKAVEVAGLASMIAVLDAIVRTLLIIAMGNLFANPGPVLLVKDFDSSSTAHSALAVLNLMTFWELAVKSVGLAKLSGASLGKAVIWVFGLWMAVTAMMIGVGVAARSAFGG
jgi:hypothetical protein